MGLRPDIGPSSRHDEPTSIALNSGGIRELVSSTCVGSSVRLLSSAARARSVGLSRNGSLAAAPSGRRKVRFRKHPRFAVADNPSLPRSCPRQVDLLCCCIGPKFAPTSLPTRWYLGAGFELFEFVWNNHRQGKCAGRFSWHGYC